MQANPASPARLLPQVTELPVTVDLAADMDTAPDTVLITEPPDMAIADPLPVPCLLQVQDLYLRQDVL